MKLKVVNAQEKDLVYIISDVSPEMNTPTLTTSETLLVGRDKNSLTLLEGSDLSSFYKYVDNRLCLYINDVILCPEFSCAYMNEHVADGIDACILALQGMMAGKTVIRCDMRRKR